ncbi:MAG: hypothetical protein QME05_05055 [Candidatus Margulisbacteria bacterium]|nr:hypothetical protein [Candidatus Margulisiibacteriota bacterium]
MVLIDQHAAHERVLFDRLTANSSQQPAAEKQILLVPERVELDGQNYPVAIDNLELLNSLGLAVEEFGGNSVLLRAVPAIIDKANPKQLLLDILTEIQNLGKSAQIETKKENILKLIACRSAIKAGDKLSQPEISQLIKDLFAAPNPLTCPHGRPILWRLSEEEIKKHFLR